MKQNSEEITECCPYHTQALETYQCPNWPTNQSDCPTNDHPTVAALHVLTERALELPNATQEQGRCARFFKTAHTTCITLF